MYPLCVLFCFSVFSVGWVSGWLEVDVEIYRKPLKIHKIYKRREVAAHCIRIFVYLFAPQNRVLDRNAKIV